MVPSRCVVHVHHCHLLAADQTIKSSAECVVVVRHGGPMADGSVAVNTAPTGAPTVDFAAEFEECETTISTSCEFLNDSFL